MPNDPPTPARSSGPHPDAVPKTYPGGRLAGNPEEQIRDRVLDTLEYSAGQILDELRAAMVKLYLKRREKQGALAFVTADDARIILETDPKYPPASRLNRNFMGQLFRPLSGQDPDWEWTGEYIKSRTQGSHANPLKCWRWIGWMKEAEGALA